MGSEKDYFRKMPESIKRSPSSESLFNKVEKVHFSAKRVGCVVCVSGLNSATPIARDVINWFQARGCGGGKL